MGRKASANFEDKDTKRASSHLHMNRKRVVRTALLVMLDAASIALAYLLALLVRFEFDFNTIGEQFLHAYQVLITPYVLIIIASMWALSLIHI